MKLNGTRLLIFLVVVQLLILIATVAAKAQPELVFRNSVLESGTNLQAGSTYRFRNVKPGIDGIITIVAFTGNMTLAELDGGSGFDEAFQPYINCAPRKQGSVEFRLDFVRTNTTTPATVTQVPMTAIDIDGWEFPDDKLYETDEFKKAGSYFVDYDMLGTSLEIRETATWYSVSNKSAITYDGIDTAQKDVMFTMSYANVSSISFKVGANNRSANSAMRLRSVYFKRFLFPNSFLSKSPLLSFRGLEKDKKVELNWELENNHNLQTIVIEKSNAGNFASIGQVLLYNEAQQSGKFKFTDENLTNGTSLYRLKMININGSVTYSNTLSFRASVADSKRFSVYPTAVTNNATLRVQSNANGIASFELIDYSGRIVHRQQLSVQAGNNNIQVTNFGNLISGQYVAVVKIDATIYSQKIFKQ